jgi:hypothetical protein
MSYNGIGVATTRGTATNGHVQRNRAYVRPQVVREKGYKVRAPLLLPPLPNVCGNS